MKTNKLKTMEVFESYFCEGGNIDNIDVDYLNETLILEMENDYNFYKAITSNRRNKITSIVWEGLIDAINLRLGWEYDEQYYCTSSQLKSIIKEDYSILNKAYEYFEEMRSKALGGALESEELEDDNSCIKEAYEYYKELHKIKE